MPLVVIKPKPKVEAAPAAAEPAPAATKSAVIQKPSTAAVADAVPMTTFAIRFSYSHQMPNEDWVKADIRIERTVPTSTLDAAYAEAQEWVDDRLGARVNEMTADPEPDTAAS